METTKEKRKYTKRKKETNKIIETKINENKTADIKKEEIKKIDIIHFSLTKRNFFKYFIFIPSFIGCFLLGIIFSHIISNFSFKIPFIIQTIGIIDSIWLLIGLILWVKFIK